jgi:phosphoribosyl-ATP pyrophosphohydrolase
LLVLLADSGLCLNDVRNELARRTGTSGLTEKANRKS